MSWILSLFLLQYTVSATAGMVRQVRGEANVKMGDVSTPGSPIETGDNGFVELQLNMGGYLRLHSNSSVVFQSVALNDIQIKLLRGSALLERGGADSDIRVRAGDLSAIIKKPGVYRFDLNSVRVFDGQLDLANGTRIRKGYEAVANEDGFDVERMDDHETSRPYSGDKVTVFVEPKQDEHGHMQFMYSIFAELCRHELEYSRDVQVVSDRNHAAYILTASGGMQINFRRVFAHADLKQRSDGAIVFSNTETRIETDQVFLQPSHHAVHALIQDILRKMHWR